MSQWSPVKPGLQTQVRVRGSGLQELSTVPAALHSQSADREHKHFLPIMLLNNTSYSSTFCCRQQAVRKTENRVKVTLYDRENRLHHKQNSPQ